MDESRFPADWQREPLSEQDRRRLRTVVIGAYVVSAIFVVVGVAIIVGLLSLATDALVVMVLASVVLAAGGFFAARKLVARIVGPVGADISANEKVVFTGTLTRIAETEASRRRRRAPGESHHRVFKATIDGELQLRCTYTDYIALHDLQGSRVIGSFTPISRLLLEAKEAPPV